MENDIVKVSAEATRMKLKHQLERDKAGELTAQAEGAQAMLSARNGTDFQTSRSTKSLIMTGMGIAAVGAACLFPPAAPVVASVTLPGILAGTGAGVAAAGASKFARS